MCMKQNRLITFLGVLALLGLLPTTMASGQAAASVSGGPYMSHEITVNAVDNSKYGPSVAYNSNHNEYLVVWDAAWLSGANDIRAQRVSARGQLLGSEFVVYSNSSHLSSEPSVAYDPVNDRYLVVFSYKNITDTDLYGRLIPWNGPSAGLTIFPIITWTSYQRNPKVIYAGGLQKQYVMVWENTVTSGTPKTYVSVKHINPDGTFTGGSADLTYSDASYNYIRPDITYNLARNEFLVVWEKFDVVNSDIWAARIHGSYGTMTGSPLAVAAWPDDETHPAVAACNIADKYLVAWDSDVGTGGTNYDLYGRIVNGDGSFGAVSWIDATTSPEIESDVACSLSGNQFLVVYQQRYTNLKYGITARRVFPNLAMEPAFQIVQPGSASDRTNPVVVSGTTSFLVAWEHERDGVAYQDIHARLVSLQALFLPLIRR
jgi:hypothetical protein